MSFAVPRSSRRTSGVGDYESTDVARNIGSLLRFGTIAEVDFTARLCRVQLNNNLTTDLVPWITIRAGGNAFWSAPSIGETVLLLSPSGELNNSVVLPALQSNPNGTWPFAFGDLEFVWGGLGEPREALWRWLFADGGIMENDPALNQFRLEQHNTRIRGAEIVHLKSEKFVYVQCEEEGGVVHVKAPMIKLEGDVQITGQLLQGGRIVGTEPDGEGLKELQLVGDPIKLNGGGGVLGIAASLVGTLASGGFSLGSLGSALGSFGNIGGALTGLATDVLGSAGMGSLLSALPVSGIGAALNVTGTLPVLGEMFNGLGFSGVLNQVGGAVQLVSGITSGSGLKLDGVFSGLSSVSSALGSAFNLPGLSNLTDNTALGAIASAIDGGSLSIDNVMDVMNGVVEVTGFTPPAGVSSALNLAMTATNVITDDNGNLAAGPQLLSNAADTVMGGLRSGLTSITDDQIANKIVENGLATVYQGLEKGEVDGGQLIGGIIAEGGATLEQVLDMQSVFSNGPGAAATVPASGGSGTIEEQQFFDHFERGQYVAPDVETRDLSDRAGSETDNRVNQQTDVWGDFFTNESPNIA